MIELVCFSKRRQRERGLDGFATKLLAMSWLSAVPTDPRCCSDLFVHDFALKVCVVFMYNRGGGGDGAHSLTHSHTVAVHAKAKTWN